MASRALTAPFKELRAAREKPMTLNELQAKAAQATTSKKVEEFDFSFGPSTHKKPPNDSTLVALDLEAETRIPLENDNDHDHQGSLALGGEKMVLAPTPQWLFVIPSIRADISQVQMKIDALEKLHNDLPSFNFAASSSKQLEIDERATLINHALQMCGKSIKSIGTNGPNKLTRQEEMLAANVRNSLALQLQEVSTKFRKSQESYLTSITQRVSKIKPIIQDEESDEDDDSFLYKGAGGDIEMQALKEERSMAKQRDKEVAQLADSIQELQVLFRDLASMVADQGTVLDRIDYNIVSASHNTDQAVEELKQAKESQGNGQKWLIGTLIAVVIITLVIILIFWLKRS